MVVELLKKLVRIPSVSGCEGKIADFVEAELKRLSMKTHRQGDNVWGVIGEGSPRLLLVSHLDTVPATDGWTKPPYEALEEGGRIYGLGANDAKASGAAMISAAHALLQKKFSGTLIVALAANEESGRNGLETFVSDLMPLDGAIVGEPNGMEICVAQKGALSINLLWHGASAHAAHGTTDHVLKKAMEDLALLSKMTWPKVDPFLGQTRVEITQIHGGERINVVPDKCTATLDIRYSPAYTAEEITSIVRLAVRGEVMVHSDRRRAVSTSSDQKIVRAAKLAQPSAPLVGSSTSSDWVFLKGIPAIKMGAGKTKRSHTANEFIEIQELEQATNAYVDTALAFFSGESN